MNQGIAETWDRLETVLSAKPNPLLRKPSRSSSPDITQRKRPPRSERPRSKIHEKSHSVSQNSSALPDTTAQGLDLSSIQRPLPPSRPLTAPIRSSRRSIRGPLSFFLEGLTEVDVLTIYKAKCEDAGIPNLPEQLRRFFEFCARNVKNRRFEMQKCGIGPSAAAAIGQVVRNNFCFSELELGKNVLTDKGGVLLAKTLSKSINLVHIGLCSNDIGPDGAAVIFRALRGNQSVTSLDISSSEGLHRNRLAVKGCEQLAVLLRENCILSHLNVAGTAVGPEGLELLTEGMRGNRSILTLDLANNALVGKTIEGFARVVVGSKLRSLNLSANKLGAAGCEPIGRLISGGFDGFCPLLSLDLSKNEITHSGAGKVFSALCRNSTLKTLNLNNNPLGPYSSTDLLAFLVENRAVSSLDVSYCDLRSEGVAVVGEGLVRNHALQTLNLSWNSLEDAGAIAIAGGIGRNDTLKTIDLSSNRIRDAGGNSLCECLKTNRMLEVIILQDNNIHDSAGQLLSEITRYNRALVRIVLRYNPINQKYVNEIKENISANRQTQRKMMTPQLESEIKRLRVREDAFTELAVLEKKKKGEEDELRRQLRDSEDKFERFRNEEERKFEVLREKMESVQRDKVKVGEELAELEDLLLEERVSGDRAIGDWDNRLATISSEVHKFQKEVTETKQHYALKRLQLTQHIAELSEQLQREKSAREMGQMALASFEKQIEQQEQEIERLEHPSLAATAKLEKTVLASEQLAVMKKQQSSKTPDSANDQAKRTKSAKRK